MLKMKWMLAAVLLSASCAVWAQTPAGQAPAGGKKELVAKVLQLQQPGIETMARLIAEQPAQQIMQQAGQALQRVPTERREALARDIEADVRKYVEEAVPIVRDRAVKVAPGTIGTLLEERFSEDELKQLVQILESPVNRKWQGMGPDMQRALTEKLVAETRGEVEPRARTMQQSVAKRLGVPAQPSPAAPAGSAPRNSGK